MIKLKNINLEGITLMEQIQKVNEEHCEFVTAVVKNDSDNGIEKFFDLVQAGLGALSKMNLDADYVMEQYPKHLEKLKSRPRVKEFGNCSMCGNIVDYDEDCNRCVNGSFKEGNFEKFAKSLGINLDIEE
ncbi:MAG: hypothetical protein RR851_13110 [Clostridium sp.]